MTDIDHIILKVNDLEQSLGFYTHVMGFEDAGYRDPFAIVRVNPGFIIQLAPWGTDGYEHYAFSMSQAQFDAVFERIKDNELEYGDAFDKVGTNSGPGVEAGAKGDAPTLYVYDPNKHLIEIRSYSSLDDV